MADWDLDEVDGLWTLKWDTWLCDDVVAICPASEASWEVAVDAACEFMDRWPLSLGRRTTDHLMALCLRNARDQK